MARSSPTEQVDGNRGAGARVHDYRHSQKQPLAADIEHNLAVQIQRGNLALDELDRQVVDCVIFLIQAWDLSPLSAVGVVSAFRQSIRAQLVKCAGAKGGLVGLVRVIPEYIRDKLLDLLEEADPRGELDFETWSAERLSFAEIEDSLSVSLAAAAGLWSELELREVALNELAESHMPMAKPLAMAAMKQAFELDDLLQEAFLILRRAAESFDPHSGNRFSSYAMPALQRELKRKSPSRIGFKRQTAEQIRAFNDVRRTLSQQQSASASLDDVYELLACKQRTKIQIENVRRILGAQRRAQRDGELHLLDALNAADPQSVNPAEDAGNREELALLEAALEKLDPLEKAVLIGVCKLGKSFRGMAKEYHKSPATLSTVFSEAIEKLAQRIDSKWIGPKPR